MPAAACSRCSWRSRARLVHRAAAGKTLRQHGTASLHHPRRLRQHGRGPGRRRRPVLPRRPAGDPRARAATEAPSSALLRRLASQFVSATATSADPAAPRGSPPTLRPAPTRASRCAPGNAVARAPVSLTSTLSDTTKSKTYCYAWTVTQTSNPAFALPASSHRNQPSLVFIPPTPAAPVARLVVTDNLGGSGINASPPPPGEACRTQRRHPGNTGQPDRRSARRSALTRTVTSPTGATPTSYTWGVTLSNGGSYSLPSGTAIHGTGFGLHAERLTACTRSA